MSIIGRIFNIPSWLWDTCFPPRVQHYQQMFVICPNVEVLKNLSDTIGKSDSVQMHINHRVVIGRHKIFLSDSDVAFVFLRKRWWANTPSATISLLHNSG